MERRVEALLAPAGIGRRSSPPSTRCACASCASTAATSACRRTSRSTTRTTALALVKECMKERELADRTFTPSAAVHAHQLPQEPDDRRDRGRARMPGGRGRRRSRRSTRATRSGCARRAPWTSTTSCCWWCGCWPRRPEVLDAGTGGSGATCWSTSTRTPTAPSTGSSACSPRSIATCACVGDPDQSIYKWRGRRHPQHPRLRARLPGHRVVRLEQNYRSTQRILAVAAAVIAHNVAAQGQDAVDRERRRASRVRVYRAWDEHEEAGFVAQCILGARAARACAYGRRRGLLSHERPVPRARGRAAAGPHPLRHRRRRALLRAARDQGHARLPAARGESAPTTWPSAGRSAPPRGASGQTTLARLDEESARQSRPLLAVAAEPPADITRQGAAGRSQDFAALIARLAAAAARPARCRPSST